ncbi:MAG: CheR family methyltransferase [Desulfobacterales bacterium]
MDDTSLNRLLEYFNLSWKGYRKVRKGVKKRIARHMQMLEQNRMEDYLEMIRQDEEARKICFQLLSVSISRFFRDKYLWNSLETDIIPTLITDFPNETKFKVWSCGCARGEEVYSFLMVWKNCKNSGYKIPDIEIFATDMNPEYLEMAKKGVYELRSLKELPEFFIEKFFMKVRGKKSYRIHFGLKEKVIFKCHDFIKESSPLRKFHIIFVRNNLLTYYNPPLRDNTLEKIIAALLPGGALVVGSHEKVSQTRFCLKRHPQITCLYFKKKTC